MDICKVKEFAAKERELNDEGGPARFFFWQDLLEYLERRNFQISDLNSKPNA